MQKKQRERERIEIVVNKKRKKSNKKHINEFSRKEKRMNLLLLSIVHE
mgnify:CR=1 FL=1